ncbi:hypothetical protein TNCV_154481 [Trichonephila clavipes]|uniref:Uncharacterized protein n=1 Tax=Trichonephila clavipes TaxID=2585209 RepID=A0A8X7BKS7_TRICX|nr:hypothetical protein TNCV_154481 [Trichonephila clavipes]
MFVNVLCLCGMGGTVNSRQAANPLIRVVEGEAPDHLQQSLSLERFSVHRTGVASSEWVLYQKPFEAVFRYNSPVNGAAVIHVGAAVAWGSRITDTAVASPLVRRLPLHSFSSVAPGLKPVRLQPRVRYHNH